jgi:long-subunit acyl-CoA synthetase (AMP-forming)
MIIIVCLHTFLTDLSMENVKRLFDIPYHQLKNYPCDDSLAARIDGKWIKHSTQDFLDNANLISRGLLKIGIEPGDKIALISNNRPEWHMLDIGILQTGAVDVPVYPTISENDYKFIFNDAAVKLCIVSSADLYAKVAAIQDEVPSLEGVYTSRRKSRRFSNTHLYFWDDRNTKRGDDLAQQHCEQLPWQLASTARKQRWKSAQFPPNLPRVRAYDYVLIYAHWCVHLFRGIDRHHWRQS